MVAMSIKFANDRRKTCPGGETCNPHDGFAVTVIKGSQIVGHIPKIIHRSHGLSQKNGLARPILDENLVWTNHFWLNKIGLAGNNFGN